MGQSASLLKLRTHAQTRIHAFSAADALFDNIQSEWKQGNERRRSLCDGGGRGCVFAKRLKSDRALSK
jgi:hypothetical protein